MELRQSITAFPLVGLLMGLALSVTAYAAGMALSPEVVPAIVLLVYIIMNGGFHLDGLSDTFDALSKRGNPGDKLKAMKDGSSGPAGVTAIVFSVLIKYLLISELLRHSHAGIFLIAVMPVLSKWAMVVSMQHGKPARPDGLGWLLMGGGTPMPGGGTPMRTLTASVITLAVFLSAAAISFREGVAGIVFAVVSMTGIYIFILLLGGLFDKRFGGLTGDTIGASGELSELIYLLGASAWLRNY